MAALPSLLGALGLVSGQAAPPPPPPSGPLAAPPPRTGPAPRRGEDGRPGDGRDRPPGPAGSMAAMPPFLQIARWLDDAVNEGVTGSGDYDLWWSRALAGQTRQSGATPRSPAGSDLPTRFVRD